MNSIGLCTIAAADTEMSLQQVLSMASETGFDGVEIWGNDRHLSFNSALRKKEKIKRLCEKLGIEILCYGSYLRLLSQKFQQEFEAVVSVCEILDCKRLRIWAGSVASIKAGRTSLRQASMELKKLAIRAAKSEIQVVLENHDNTLCDSAEAIIDLINCANESNVGVYAQPSWPGTSSNFIEHLQKLQPVLVGIHAQNYSKSYENPELLSNGDVDYKSVASFLQKANLCVPVMIEFPGLRKREQFRESLCKDLKYLKGLLKTNLKTAPGDDV